MTYDNVKVNQKSGLHALFEDTVLEKPQGKEECHFDLFRINTYRDEFHQSKKLLLVSVNVFWVSEYWYQHLPFGQDHNNKPQKSKTFVCVFFSGILLTITRLRFSKSTTDKYGPGLVIPLSFLWQFFCYHRCSTIIFIIFWEFLLFHQICLSPQTKQNVIISNEHGICLTSCRTT